MPALTNEQCYANASRFAGRVCLITGAGSGFGRATAVEFAKYGAKLVLGDVDEKGMKETVKLVEKAGGCVAGRVHASYAARDMAWK